mgnify:CR=1 FL=1
MKNNFDALHKAAVSNNQEFVKDIYEQGGIDEFKTGTFHWTVAAQCEYDRNYAAVERLIECGAGINAPVKAAAMRGDYARVEHYLNEGADISFAATGAALAKNQSYANQLILRGAHRDWVVFGAAYAGDRAYVMYLLEQGADPVFAIKGAALKGDLNYCLDLLECANSDKNNPFNYYPSYASAAKYSGIGGHFDIAKELFGKHSCCRRTFIEGCVMGWQFAALDRFYLDHPQYNRSYKRMTNDAVKAGHVDWLNTYSVANYDLAHSIWLAAKYGHFKLADNLLRRWGFSYIEAAVRGAGNGGHISYFQRLRQLPPQTLPPALRANKAECDDFIYGALLDKYFVNSQCAQLRCLPFFAKELLPAIFQHCEKNHTSRSVKISNAVRTRVLTMANYMQRKPDSLTHSQALVKTAPDATGLLYLLRLLYESPRGRINLNQSMEAVPDDIFYGTIFPFYAPYLSKEDFIKLGQVAHRECESQNSYLSSCTLC